jgi:hypothetical protein
MMLPVAGLCSVNDRMIMNMDQLVKKQQARETKVLGENLPK